MNYDQSLPSEFRKQEGIFYTPVFLAKAMVFELLESWFSEKEKEVLTEKTDFGLVYFHKILTIKFLDPACGTGDFLKPAFEILCKKLKEILLQINDYQAFSYDYENHLLENCLFGVDIDEQAVEICRKTLKIKHIRVGNSLISDPKIDAKAFVWEKEFSEVFEAGGFDRVVANPPYVRIQYFANKNFHDYFKKCFFTALQGNYDLYTLFVEQGNKLLKSKGTAGFIVPNKFFSTDYGALLRNYLIDNQLIKKIVNFGHEQVFENVSVYSCLIFLEKMPKNSLEYVQVTLAKFLEKEKIFNFQTIPYINLAQKTWIFGNDLENELLKKLTLKGKSLLEIPCQMSRGSSTGADSVFILQKINENEFVNSLGEKVLIEESILKIPIFATDFSRYEFKKQSNYRVIFPYQNPNFKILEELDFKTRFPLAYKYLKKHKKKLGKRKKIGIWYGYSAARNLAQHPQSKILIPLLADRGLFAFMPKNAENYTLMAGGGFSLSFEKNEIEENYLLALLNSKLLFWHLQKKSNVFRGGWITCTKQYFSELRIILALDQQIFIDLVSQILSLKSQQKDSSALENQVDDLVYKLYDLTEEEIQFVENQ